MTVRIKQRHPVMQFTDQLRGETQADPQPVGEDFIIHRRDGPFAYNLVVVVDDRFQGVIEIVRGADLIEPMVRQISLYQQLGWRAPDYIYLPLAFNEQGIKLSKQSHAPAPLQGDPRPMIIVALRLLGHRADIPWQDIQADQILESAAENWHLTTVPESAILNPALSNVSC